MIDSKERARREDAHVVADMAWSDAGKRSRTGGLSDMIRGSNRKAVPPEVRKLRQDLHKKRQRDAAARDLKNSRPWDTRALDRSRYFPHQGERERTRGARRAA